MCRWSLDWNLMLQGRKNVNHLMFNFTMFNLNEKKNYLGYALNKGLTLQSTANGQNVWTTSGGFDATQ